MLREQKRPGIYFEPHLDLGVHPCGSLGVDWLRQEHSFEDFCFDATDLNALGWETVICRVFNICYTKILIYRLI